jgi:hypothetical protein
MGASESVDDGFVLNRRSFYSSIPYAIRTNIHGFASRRWSSSVRCSGVKLGEDWR